MGISYLGWKTKRVIEFRRIIFSDIDEDRYEKQWKQFGEKRRFPVVWENTRR